MLSLRCALAPCLRLYISKLQISHQ